MLGSRLYLSPFRIQLSIPDKAECYRCDAAAPGTMGKGKAKVHPGGDEQPLLIMASSNTKRTRIVSRKILPNNLTEANKLFLYRGRDGQEACIMVQPYSSTCLCYEATACCPIPFLSVPSGPIVLWQKCGTNQGSLNPGCQPCWCGWNRVSHLVSKQLVTYNHMPKKCPTRDHQGRKRERNSQLHRLLSRPFCTRFG